MLSLKQLLLLTVQKQQLESQKQKVLQELSPPQRPLIFSHGLGIGESPLFFIFRVIRLPPLKEPLRRRELQESKFSIVVVVACVAIDVFPPRNINNRFCHTLAEK